MRKLALVLIVLLLLPFCACHAESLDLSQLSNVELRALTVEINDRIKENAVEYKDEVPALFMENMLALGHELKIEGGIDDREDEFFVDYSDSDFPTIIYYSLRVGHGNRVALHSDPMEYEEFRQYKEYANDILVALTFAVAQAEGGDMPWESLEELRSELEPILDVEPPNDGLFTTVYLPLNGYTLAQMMASPSSITICVY